MEVADVGFVFDGFATQFVGGADRVAGITAAPGQPHAHGVGIVVATIGGPATDAVIGRATELAAPDDEGALEEPTLLEVGNEGGDGLVYATNEVAVGALDVVVAVPRAIVQLYEPHTFFDELAGQRHLRPNESVESLPIP